MLRSLRWQARLARRPFLVALGVAAQEKHGFRVGDRVRGESELVGDPRLETAEFYKTAKLVVVDRTDPIDEPGPPWRGLVPPLETYRSRGHRRLAAKTFEAKCRECLWGARMAVEIQVDHWRKDLAPRYRFETFCYGPKSCPVYKPGPKRQVPGRRGSRWIEDDWVDENETAGRGAED